MKSGVVANIRPSLGWTLCRFRKQICGDSEIGNYVSTISRLNILWTAACGVVEIVRMIQRREDLLEVSSVNGALYNPVGAV